MVFKAASGRPNAEAKRARRRRRDRDDSPEKPRNGKGRRHGVEK